MIRTSCLLIAALLAGCGSTPPVPKEPPPAPLVNRPGAKLVTVSEAQTGANVMVELAQELVVSLPVNPTNGLEWSVVDLAPGVLTLAETKFERDLRSANIGEASGTTNFHFKPRAAGQVTLNFDLRKPRSLVPASQTVVYRVTVK